MKNDMQKTAIVNAKELKEADDWRFCAEIKHHHGSSHRKDCPVKSKSNFVSLVFNMKEFPLNQVLKKNQFLCT